MELRCQNRNLFGVVDDGQGTLEVACSNRLCGKEPGVVVRHRFDLSTGKVLKTMRFQDPAKLFSPSIAKKGA